MTARIRLVQVVCRVQERWRSVTVIVDDLMYACVGPQPCMTSWREEWMQHGSARDRRHTTKSPMYRAGRTSHARPGKRLMSGYVT